MLKIIMVALLLCSCTVLSPQMKLEHGFTEPTPLEDVAITITELGFLEAGWVCLDNAGMPKFLHPIVVQVFGCSDVYVRDGKVVRCDVILGTSSEYIRQHELKHCEGYID